VALIQQLVSQLGVQEGQARGGAGLLFKLAKDRLGSGEFSQIAQKVPGAEELSKEAPKSGGMMGAMGGWPQSLAARPAKWGTWLRSRVAFQS
jgi:hypothetical protein